MFSTLLKDYRKASGISQSAIAEILGVSTEHVSRIENNRKQPSAKLCNEILKFIRESDISNLTEIELTKEMRVIIFDYLLSSLPENSQKNAFDVILYIFKLFSESLDGVDHENFH